jgi:hypothetical protein
MWWGLRSPAPDKPYYIACGICGSKLSIEYFWKAVPGFLFQRLR